MPLYKDINQTFERMTTGPHCSEKEWDMKILPSIIKRKVKEHDIRCNLKNPVPTDNSLVDSVFKAGFELAVEAGLLCTSTERRILYDEKELRSVIKDVPSKITVGAEKDVKTMQHRAPEDRSSPFNLIGPIGIVVRQEYFSSLCEAYLIDPNLDAFEGPTLDRVEGHQIQAGTPSEVMAGILETQMTREACRNADRPNVAIDGIANSPTHLAHIAAANPNFGFYTSDISMAPIVTELKTNYSQIMKALHSTIYGTVTNGYGHPMIGGFAGGPEGCAITLIATTLLSMAAHGSEFSAHSVIDVRSGCNSSRHSIWAQNAAHQAISRNTHFVNGPGRTVSAGCCTSMIFDEVLALTIGDLATGCSFTSGVRPLAGKVKEACTPFESMFFGNLTRTIPKMGLKLDKANELVDNYIKKYENRMINPPQGKSLLECYNLDKTSPSREYQNLYNNALEELKEYNITIESYT